MGVGCVSEFKPVVQDYLTEEKLGELVKDAVKPKQDSYQTVREKYIEKLAKGSAPKLNVAGGGSPLGLLVLAVVTACDQADRGVLAPDDWVSCQNKKIVTMNGSNWIGDLEASPHNYLSFERSEGESTEFCEAIFGSSDVGTIKDIIPCKFIDVTCKEGDLTISMYYSDHDYRILFDDSSLTGMTLYLDTVSKGHFFLEWPPSPTAE